MWPLVCQDWPFPEVGEQGWSGIFQLWQQYFPTVSRILSNTHVTCYFFKITNSTLSRIQAKFTLFQQNKNSCIYLFLFLMHEDSSDGSIELFSVSIQSYPLLLISVGLIVWVGPTDLLFKHIFLHIQVTMTHSDLWVYHIHAVSITNNGVPHWAGTLVQAERWGCLEVVLKLRKNTRLT